MTARSTALIIHSIAMTALELASGRMDALRLLLVAAAEPDCPAVLAFVVPQLSATSALATKCLDALAAALPLSSSTGALLARRQCLRVSTGNLAPSPAAPGAHRQRAQRRQPSASVLQRAPPGGRADQTGRL